VTLTVRALPTAYDPPAGAVTVATPSCCCCCCCCLATLGSVAGFTAGAAHETALRYGRPRGRVTAMAALALPLAVATMIVLFNVIDGLQGVESAEGTLNVLVWVSAIAIYLGLAGAALRLAGASWGRAAGTPVSVALVAPVAFVVELPLALFTVFLVELAAPVAVLLGVKLGRATHRGPVPTSWPVAVPPGWALPPPPPPPGLLSAPDGDPAARTGQDLPALPSAPTPPRTDRPTSEDEG
jgi:hypothetical protein